MKKFFALLAVVLAVVSCQKDVDVDVNVGGEVDTVVTVSLPETTRATNSAEGAFDNVVGSDEYTIRYIFQVFYNGTESKADRQVIYSDNKVVCFPVRLVPDRHYNFVVWADVTTTAGKTLDTIHKLTIAQATAADIHYNTKDLTNITLNNEWNAMDETRDAFTGHFDTAVDGDKTPYNGAKSINFRLTRPFAKLRIITTDMEQLNDLVIAPNTATVEYTVDHYNAFNAFAGQVIADSKNRDIKHENFNIKAYDDNVDDESMVLFTDYFFAADNDEVINFTFDVYDQNNELIKSNAFTTDIPVKRNNLTTIKGNVLTDGNNITVEIKPDFANDTEWNPEEDQYDVEVWDGVTITAPAYNEDTKTYTVKNGAQLAWIADQVNGVTRAGEAKTFIGETIVLANDIDLGGNRWTPIGNSSNHSSTFRGTFDGNGKKITNLSVSGGTGVGLFGMVSPKAIKNLTIENAVIYGTHYAGALAGWVQSVDSQAHNRGAITNCHIKNAKVVLSVEEKDNGDKAAGLVGYAVRIDVNGCSVENAEVAAYRDVAGLLGVAHEGCVVSTNVVKDVTVTADQTVEYGEVEDSNAGEVVGRIMKDAVVENNTTENVTVIRKVDSTEELAYAVADAKSGDTIYVATGEYTALTGVKDGLTIDATGAVFTGKSSVSGNGAKIIGATFRNNFNSDADNCLTGNLNNTIFENCVFEAYSSARYCYANGDIVFNNCKFGTPESWRGIHFDAGNGTVTFNNCDLYGFQAFGRALTKVTFNDCNFYKGRSTNVVNMYNAFEYNGCKFVVDYYCDCADNGVVAAFNNCSYADNSDITKIVRFDKDKTTCTITFDGYEYVAGGLLEDENGNYVVNSLTTLETALETAGAAGAGDTTIVFAENAELDMTNVEWNPIEVDGYHGADIVTIEGNGAVIKGLKSALFAGGFAGGSGIVIKNLTIENSEIVADDTQGYGAFVNCADSMDEITLINCHLKNSSIITPNNGANDSRIGGLVGWTAGYGNQNDGPVDSYITIENCSVTGCTLKGAGSIGGICGHAGANKATYTTITNCTVTGNTFISTDNGDWRVGVVVGTANNGQCVISNITESGNTLEQTGKTAPTGEKRNYYGRFVPAGTGTLTIDDEEVIIINSAESLAAVIENAKAGDTITIAGDITLTEAVTIPAGVIFNGNGKQINGTLIAGGDIAFAGHTKVTAFSAGFNGNEITIDEGACLEIIGGGRSTMGYNNTFNITGTITDAKSVDKANIQPSLIMPAGISITGGNGLELNIKDAYVQLGSTTSKNSAANGTFTINIENSIAEFTNQLTFAEPTSGMNPTFNLNVKNSVLTTAAKLILTAKNCNMVVDNSTIDVKTYFRNSGNVELKNGSVLTGNTVQFGENGGHDGKTVVDASTLTIKASSTGHAFDGKGTGSIEFKNGAVGNIDYYKALTINTDATSTFTGTEAM